jgi:acetyl esterase/lipase
VRKFLLNLLLRRLVKPMWRRAPSIELLRKRAAMIDRRLGAAGARRPALLERLSEQTAGLWLGPRERAPQGVILYLHGGAFCVHLPALYREFCFDLARRSGVPVLLPDYRLAPEHPAPAALDDCEQALRHLLRDVPAHRIVLAGDSAGGNLALALLQRCRRVGLPMPAGAVLLSPVTDLSGEGWSVHFNEERDVMFTSHALEVVVDHYLPRVLADDPEVSPLHGSWSGTPPLRFHVSSSEMLLDHSLRAVERARLHGVDAQAKVWLDLPHVFPMFGALDEANQCRAEIAAFVNARLAAPGPSIDGKRIADSGSSSYSEANRQPMPASPACARLHRSALPASAQASASRSTQDSETAGDPFSW